MLCVSSILITLALRPHHEFETDLSASEQAQAGSSHHPTVRIAETRMGHTLLSTGPWSETERSSQPEVTLRNLAERIQCVELAAANSLLIVAGHM